MLSDIKYCPGTLAEGFSTYSQTCLKRVFDGKKVHHILPYAAPSSNAETDELFAENRRKNIYFRRSGKVFNNTKEK